MSPRRQPSPEEMSQWEKKLAEEGMPSEPEEDMAAAALREEEGVTKEKWHKTSDVRREMQKYWQFRAGSSFGEHLQAAIDIANRLGVEPGDVNEAMMKEVEEEVAEAQKGVSDMIDEIYIREGRTDIHPKRLTNMLLKQAKEKFVHIDESVLEDIVADAVGRDES